ncbi:MAG: hypothetical protein PHU78_06670, partial [Heliobacteriaceae bacterium]|nr:hypothetical protein [Heliobacteriaceae bacterium]
QAQKITEHMDAQFKARQEAGFTNCHPFQGKQLGPRPDKNWQGEKRPGKHRGPGWFPRENNQAKSPDTSTPEVQQ